MIHFSIDEKLNIVYIRAVSNTSKNPDTSRVKRLHTIEITSVILLRWFGGDAPDIITLGHRKDIYE